MQKSAYVCGVQVEIVKTSLYLYYLLGFSLYLVVPHSNYRKSIVNEWGVQPEKTDKPYEEKNGSSQVQINRVFEQFGEFSEHIVLWGKGFFGDEM